MLTGFNHNVTYRERTYHVQTEDGGDKAPQVITLLYVGGVIITSVKTSYAEMVGHAEQTAAVQVLMREQHKTVLRRLIHGDFDQVIATRLVNLPPSKAPSAAAPTPAAAEPIVLLSEDDLPEIEPEAIHEAQAALPATPPKAAEAAAEPSLDALILGFLEKKKP